MKYNDRYNIEVDEVAGPQHFSDFSGKVDAEAKFSAEVDDHHEKRVYLLNKTFATEDEAFKAAESFIKTLGNKT